MNKKTLAFLLLIVIIIGATFSWKLSPSLAILPPEEGLTSGVYGWQESLYGTLYSAKNIPMPPEYPNPGWQLVNDDPHNYIIGYWHYFTIQVTGYYERTDCRIEVSQPWREKYQEIQYKIKNVNGTFTLIQGEVWIYHIDLAFSILRKDKPGVWIFKDNPVWLSFVTSVWNRVWYEPLTGKEGRAWGAPISVYIEYYKVADGSGDHYHVEPSLQGRFFTIYDQPDTNGVTIDDLGISSGANLNQTLSAENEAAPDTRMTGTTYGRWILSDFGITTQWNWLGGIDARYYPAVNYRLKVYFLALGKWTFTKNEDEDWDERKSDVERFGLWASWVWFWDGLFNFLNSANPFRIFGDAAGIIAFVALAAIGLVALWIVVKIVVHRAIPARGE